MKKLKIILGFLTLVSLMGAGLAGASTLEPPEFELKKTEEVSHLLKPDQKSKLPNQIYWMDKPMRDRAP